MTTNQLPEFGPGDLPDVIDEPNYEESLRKSAEIFGGSPEDYRLEGMTQEKWEALGNPSETLEETRQRFVESDRQP